MPLNPTLLPYVLIIATQSHLVDAVVQEVMAIRAETPYLLRMTSKTNGIAILVKFCLGIWSNLPTFKIFYLAGPFSTSSGSPRSKPMIIKGKTRRVVRY